MCQLPVMSVLKFIPSFPFIDLLIQSSCDLKSLTIKAQTKVKSRPPRLGKQWKYAARTHCARRLILSLEGEGRLGPACHLSLLTYVLAVWHHAVGGWEGALINGRKKRREFRQSFCREPSQCWRAWNPLVFQFVWAAAQFRQTWRLHVRTKHRRQMLLLLSGGCWKGVMLLCRSHSWGCAVAVDDWLMRRQIAQYVMVHHGTEEAVVGRVVNLEIAENWQFCCSGSNYYWNWHTVEQVISKKCTDKICTDSLKWMPSSIRRGCVKPTHVMTLQIPVVQLPAFVFRLHIKCHLFYHMLWKQCR